MVQQAASCVARRGRGMQILGEGILDISTFTTEQLTRSEPHAAKLRIKSPKGKAGGGGVLHLLLSYTPAKPAPASQPSSFGGEKTSSTKDSSPIPARLPSPGRAANGLNSIVQVLSACACSFHIRLLLCAPPAYSCVPHVRAAVCPTCA